MNIPSNIKITNVIECVTTSCSNERLMNINFCYRANSNEYILLAYLNILAEQSLISIIYKQNHLSREYIILSFATHVGQGLLLVNVICYEMWPTMALQVLKLFKFSP
jgi:hypothetical protein